MICRRDIVKNKQVSQGFILLEVLAAVMIFTVGIAGVNATLIQATRINASAANITAASDLARQLFEQIKAGQEPDAEQALSCGTSTTVFSVRWQARPYPDNPVMKNVTVTVDWQERGLTQKIVMATILLPKNFPLAPQPEKR